MVKRIVLVMAILMAFSTVSFGAARDFQGISSKSNEMRQNLAWLTEGLYQLGNSKNAKLVLTKEQKKKILPIFQGMVDKNLIMLKLAPNNGRNGNNRANGNNQGGQNQGGQRGSFDVNDPQVQARIKQMQELTDFGNAQIDLVDKILTKGQVNFLDNMDFNAEKYGFIDYQRMFANNSGNNGQESGQSQGGGQSQMGGQGANQAEFQKLRQKMRAAQEQLVKLNNDVMKVLKS